MLLREKYRKYTFFSRNPQQRNQLWPKHMLYTHIQMRMYPFYVIAATTCSWICTCSFMFNFFSSISILYICTPSSGVQVFRCNRLCGSICLWVHTFIQIHLSHLLSSGILVAQGARFYVTYNNICTLNTQSFLETSQLSRCCCPLFYSVSSLYFHVLFFVLLSFSHHSLQPYGKFIHVYDVLLIVSLRRLFMQAHYNPCIWTICLFVFCPFFYWLHPATHLLIHTYTFFSLLLFLVALLFPHFVLHSTHPHSSFFKSRPTIILLYKHFSLGL